MYGKIRADNFFYTTLATEINATDKVGTFELTSKTVNGYTVEDGSYMFWMIVGLNDPATAEVFRITNVAGTVLTYDKRISPTGMAIHTVGSLANMQASSDFINWLSNNTNDLGYTETVDGTGNELKIKIYGGRIENPSAADIVVSDTILTLAINTTNYVYFDDSDNTIKGSIIEPETYKVFAKVITGTSAVTSIEDYRAEKIIMGAVPLSLAAADIAALTNVRNGTIVFNKTTGENQQYLGGAWSPIASGSTQPRATETVEGKVRIATDAEYAAGTEIGPSGETLVSTPAQTQSVDATTTIKGVARLATQAEVVTGTNAETIVTPANLKVVTDANVPSSLIITSDYPLGEAITDITKSCVFKETAPTFAQATSVVNIGEITENIRVSFIAIGTGVASDNLKLSLAKNGSPSAFLRVRIETDNAGSQSGTLVDPNATKDIAPATLTTSLVDTTVAFPGSFTVANGTKVHIVVSAVGDVVNSSNYYKIGYNTNDTTTRYGQNWNGTQWGKLQYTTDDDQINLSNNSSDVTYGGYRLKARYDLAVKTVNKNANCTATKAYLKNDAGTLLATAIFSGNVATFGLYSFNANDYFRIELGSDGSTYQSYRNASPGFPKTGTNIIYNTGSFGGDNNGSAYNIDSIETNVFTAGAYDNNFKYISSTLFHNTVLSLTDSDFVYKVDLYGIATATGVVGSYPKLHLPVDGAVIPNFTGMADGAVQFLSGTPGAISSTAGTYRYKIGVSKHIDELLLGGGIIGKFPLLNNTIYYASQNGFVSGYYWNNYNGNHTISLVGYADYSAGLTQVAKNDVLGNQTYTLSLCFPVMKGQYFKVHGYANLTDSDFIAFNFYPL